MLHIQQYITYTTIYYIYNKILHIQQYITYTTIYYIHTNILHIQQYITYTTNPDEKSIILELSIGNLDTI